MILPLRIAEGSGSGGKRVCTHWRPDRLPEVGGGFHDERQAAVASDVEPELPGLHPETGIAGRDL